AADQARARPFPANVVIGERDLERGINRLRSRIAEKGSIEPRWRQGRNAARQLEGLRMRKLKRWRVVELRRPVLDGSDDRIALMAGMAAPQTRRRIQNAATLRREIVHVLRPREQPRRSLERPIGRERHPERVEIVGPRRGGPGIFRTRHREILCRNGAAGGSKSAASADHSAARYQARGCCGTVAMASKTGISALQWPNAELTARPLQPARGTNRPPPVASRPERTGCSSLRAPGTPTGWFDRWLWKR